MFVIGSNRKEFENQGVNCICLHMSAVREMVAPIYKHLFVLTYSHSCFNVGLLPSFSLTEQQYSVCYWSNIMIKGAVCRTKNRPAIQLCYPAVHCLRQVVSFFPPGRLGQVQGVVGDTNHQCSKQRSSPEKETCDYSQKACLVCGKNAGGASNHNPNND